MIFTYLLIAFAIVTGINCLYFLFFSKFSFSKHKTEANNSEPVSVIVYMKNQEDLLDEFIPKLINQKHSNFEIVLVNNASYDNTLDILERFQEENNIIKIVDVENNEAFWGSKKYALTLGIKKATHKKLLFITPNTAELSENWITETSKLLANDNEIVVGYNNFKKSKGFASLLMRYSRFQSTIQNFGIGAFTKPYRAWQNNLGFTSELFFENNGYSSHMNVSYETENLFIKEAATSKNVIIASSKDSITYNKTFKFSEWFKNAKERLLSIKYYSPGVKLSLGLFFITQLLFWIGGIAGSIVFLNMYWFALIAIRFLIVGIVIGKSAFKLCEKDLFYLFPFLEVINILMQSSIFISNIFSKPKR